MGIDNTNKLSFKFVQNINITQEAQESACQVPTL